MSSDIAFLAAPITQYIAGHTSGPSALEHRLIAETRALPEAQMQIGVPQAQFMAMLARTLRPQTVVEVGTFTGYSALRVAQELDDQAQLIACDVSTEWTSIAERYWLEAGVDHKIDLRIGPASQTLRALPADLTVDLAFIDADKTGYLDYLEVLIPHLDPRSVVLVDNVLWSGSVIDRTDESPDTQALREFNAAVVGDPRLDVALLPIGDGLSMIMLAR